MAEWQPIETAPKDGTRFLAYAPGGPTWSAVMDVVWFYQWSDGRHELQMHRGEGVSDGMTHWMPLPPPPVT